jgi:hypothetical protein
MTDPDPLWSSLHDHFAEDDGSLPELHLDGLPREAIPEVFGMLWERGRDVTAGGARFHDRRDGQDRPLNDPREVGRLVVAGEADVHVVLAGLESGGSTIPDLGVLVHQDGLILDYRMGADWGPPQLLALFGLIHELAASSPAMTVAQLDAGEAFSSAWRSYTEGKDVS